MSHVTVIHSVPSRLTVMKPDSAGVSLVSLDPNVTAAQGGSSTSRRAAAYVSIHSGYRLDIISLISGSTVLSPQNKSIA